MNISKSCEATESINNSELELTTTIDEFPNEVFCKIFRLVNAGTQPKSTRAVLSQVSFRWWKIALSIPELWTTIRISQSDPDTLKEIFKKSAGLPLDLVVALPGPSITTLHRWKTLIALGNEIHRCRSLEIFTNVATFKALRNMLGDKCAVPLLSSLSLTRCDTSPTCCDAWTEDDVLPQFGLDLQVLSHVTLNGVIFLPTNGPFYVETLVIKNAGKLSASGYLCNAPQYSRLTLAKYLDMRYGNVIPALTHLSIYETDPSKILDKWIMPALTNLTISQVSPETWSAWMEFLTDHPHHANLATIESLTLEMVEVQTTMRVPDVMRLATAMPLLRQINFFDAIPLGLRNWIRGVGIWPLLTSWRGLKTGGGT